VEGLSISGLARPEDELMIAVFMGGPNSTVGSVLAGIAVYLVWSGAKWLDSRSKRRRGSEDAKLDQVQEQDSEFK
jgi:ABC-type branched-subunit amino acid transport system permease subunit